MDYGVIDFIYLIGSLGLFLYGMKIMSEGLQKVAGERMKSILSVMTSNRLAGVFTGILVTGLIQSSSATTVMVVSFVNAGLLSLTQAISVIMGANIGTTATAWLISLLGFKVNISSFAIPVVAIALPLIFSKNPKWNSWGDFVLGFSLLFLGLQFLKDSMPDLQNNPEALAFLQKYTNMGFGSVLLFLLIGSILTFIVQSSSATVAITLIMCSQGWIPFEMGAAMILGENIGTTITANLAALNANIAAKRAAFSHFLFNVFGVIWVLFLFYPLVNLVSNMVMGMDGHDPRSLFPLIADLNMRYQSGDVALLTGTDPIFDPEMSRIQANIMAMAGSISIALTLFHTLFNIANTFVLVWFVPGIARICEGIIKPSKKQEQKRDFAHLQYLSPRMLSTSELSLLQVNKELVNYCKKTQEMMEMVKQLFDGDESSDFEDIFNRIDKYERICDRVEIEIVQYLTALSEGDLSGDSRTKVRNYLRISSEIENIGDACYNMARILRRKAKDEINSVDLLKDQLLELHETVDHIMNKTLETLEVGEVYESVMIEAKSREKSLNSRIKSLIAKNLKDLESEMYTYQHSVYYLDMLDEYESIGDHAYNIVQALERE